MNPSLKAFLISIPIGTAMWGLLIWFSVAAFGEPVNWTVMNIIAFATGLVTFRSVSKYLAIRA